MGHGVGQATKARGKIFMGVSLPSASLFELSTYYLLPNYIFQILLVYYIHYIRFLFVKH